MEVFQEILKEHCITKNQSINYIGKDNDEPKWKAQRKKVLNTIDNKVQVMILLKASQIALTYVADDRLFPVNSIDDIEIDFHDDESVEMATKICVVMMETSQEASLH